MWGKSKEQFENKKHNIKNKSTLKEQENKNTHKSVSDDIMAELNEIKSAKGEVMPKVSNPQDKDLKHNEEIKANSEKQEDKSIHKSVSDDIMAELNEIKSAKGEMAPKASNPQDKDLGHNEEIKANSEKQEDKNIHKSVTDDIMAELQEIKSCHKEEVTSAPNKSHFISKDVKQGKEKSKDKSDEKEEKSYKGCIGEIVFYLFLIAAVFGIFTLKGNGAPNSIAGFSAFTVLSSSMESEIPKGSLVITKRIDPNELKVGDDITYMNSPTTTITHRIVDVIEEYDEFGDRAFKTKGIMNDSPDKLPVPAANVVGKVIFHNYELGQVVEFVSQYWYIIIIFFILFFGFYALIKKLFLKPEKREE